MTGAVCMMRSTDAILCSIDDMAQAPVVGSTKRVPPPSSAGAAGGGTCEQLAAGPVLAGRRSAGRLGSGDPFCLGNQRLKRAIYGVEPQEIAIPHLAKGATQQGFGRRGWPTEPCPTRPTSDRR